MPSEKHKEKRMKKHKQHLKSLWDINTCTNICKIGVPQDEKNNIQKKFEDIITETFPNFMKKIHLHIQMCAVG